MIVFHFLLQIQPRRKLWTWEFIGSGQVLVMLNYSKYAATGLKSYALLFWFSLSLSRHRTGRLRGWRLSSRCLWAAQRSAGGKQPEERPIIPTHTLLFFSLTAPACKQSDWSQQDGTCQHCQHWDMSLTKLSVFTWLVSLRQYLLTLVI